MGAKVTKYAHTEYLHILVDFNLNHTVYGLGCIPCFNITQFYFYFTGIILLCLVKPKPDLTQLQQLYLRFHIYLSKKIIHIISELDVVKLFNVMTSIPRKFLMLSQLLGKFLLYLKRNSGETNQREPLIRCCKHFFLEPARLLSLRRHPFKTFYQFWNSLNFRRFQEICRKTGAFVMLVNLSKEIHISFLEQFPF